MEFLTPHERDSPLGKKLFLYYTERLEQLRRKNDHDMDEHNRAMLVAQIKEVKAFLRLYEPITAASQDTAAPFAHVYPTPAL